MKPIKWICGFEPKQDGALPTFFEVNKNSVSKIEHRVENYGDHGIGWYDVYFGDEVLQSMAAKAVAEIRFQD